MNFSNFEIKNFLDKKTEQYNHIDFIHTDPVQIPHLFSNPRDIEISAFLTAIISWGQRKTIISNSRKLMNLMDMQPYSFIINAGENDLKSLAFFKHRTFNSDDCIFMVKSLRNIYSRHEGLYSVFLNEYKKSGSVKMSLINFRKVFFEIDHPERTGKHISDPGKNSASKRLNMFLRWMVRKDYHEVDFGLWDKISMADLFLPLDIHTGNVSRKLGLLSRKQNDWKAVEELTSVLRTFDPLDPVKYDYALFGTGIFEKY
jgi:uncharacterized protein (TIGR02757 family)